MRPSPISPTVDLDKDGVQHGHLRLPYSRDDSAWGSVMIPIAVIRNGAGPTALLTGANHGDEYEGPLALFELARTLDPREVAGTVIIVPAMNYPAFRAGTRTSPIDRGNLNGPGNPWQPPVNGYRHLPEVIDWNRRTHDAVYADLSLGHLPILLGGDHCICIGSISAAARHCRDTRRQLRVLWLDAHADFNTSELSPSGNIHGMPVACLCGFGPREVPRNAQPQCETVVWIIAET